MSRITLLQTLRGEEAELVFAHEYGHYVWDRMLSLQDRADYRRAWTKEKRARRLVTRYAGEDEEEGFAEDFAHYILKLDVLRRRAPESSSFLAALAARNP